MRCLRLSLLILLCGTQLLFSQAPTEVVLDSTEVENLNEVIISATRTKRQLASATSPPKPNSDIEPMKIFTYSIFFEHAFGIQNWF